MRFVSARPFVLIGPAMVIGCLIAADGTSSRVGVRVVVLMAAVILFVLLCALRAPVPARLVALAAVALQLGLVLAEWVESGAMTRHERLRRLRGPTVIEGIVVSQPRAIGPPRPPP